MRNALYFSKALIVWRARYNLIRARPPSGTVSTVDLVAEWNLAVTQAHGINLVNYMYYHQ